MKKIIFSEKGLTLIEIIVSLVLLSIIVVSLSSLFVQSARSNTISRTRTESTYIARSEIEEIIHLQNSSLSLQELSSQLINHGYYIDATCTNCFAINQDSGFVLVQITKVSDTLGKILLKRFEDESKNNLEAQYEMIISLKTRW